MLNSWPYWIYLFGIPFAIAILYHDLFAWVTKDKKVNVFDFLFVTVASVLGALVWPLVLIGWVLIVFDRMVSKP